MARFQHHIFTCTNTPDDADARGCCAGRGGEQVAAWFKAEAKARHWKGRVRTNTAGCLDACAFGPVVVVYPEQVWYSPRTREDVAAICTQHIEGGEPVVHLMLLGLE